MPSAIDGKDAIKKSGGDAKIFGNPDMWVLAGKFSSKNLNTNKSTKVLNLPTGMLVQVTSEVGVSNAEALQWVPGLNIVVNAGNRAVLDNSDMPQFQVIEL